MEDLKYLKDSIELLPVVQQIGIGRLLNENNIVMIENKNGVFVNLTDVSVDILEKIKQYMVHINQQEKSIEAIELKKQEYKDNFFTSINEVCDE